MVNSVTCMNVGTSLEKAIKDWFYLKLLKGPILTVTTVGNTGETGDIYSFTLHLLSQCNSSHLDKKWQLTLQFLQHSKNKKFFSSFEKKLSFVNAAKPDQPWLKLSFYENNNYDNFNKKRTEALIVKTTTTTTLRVWAQKIQKIQQKLYK